MGGRESIKQNKQKLGSKDLNVMFDLNIESDKIYKV